MIQFKGLLEIESTWKDSLKQESLLEKLLNNKTIKDEKDNENHRFGGQEDDGKNLKSLGQQTDKTK